MSNAKAKAKKEKYCELLYNKILKDIVKPFTGDQTTYLSELLGAGKKFLGVKFKGVYPSDKIPKLNDLAPYAILNLDTSKMPGSHWVAIAKSGNDTYIYDSFGRSNIHIIPNLEFSGNGKIIDSDRDAEQGILDTDCGARSIAWLIFLDKWGIDCAKLI
jgi:hypothetical protein